MPTITTRGLVDLMIQAPAAEIGEDRGAASEPAAPAVDPRELHAFAVTAANCSAHVLETILSEASAEDAAGTIVKAGDRFFTLVEPFLDAHAAPHLERVMLEVPEIDPSDERRVALKVLMVAANPAMLAYLQREAPAVFRRLVTAKVKVATLVCEALGWNPRDFVELAKRWRDGDVNASEAGQSLDLPPDTAGAILAAAAGKLAPISDEAHERKLARIRAARSAGRAPAVDAGHAERQAVFAGALEGRDVRWVFAE